MSSSASASSSTTRTRTPSRLGRGTASDKSTAVGCTRGFDSLSLPRMMSGSVTTKVAPCPSPMLFAWIEPPCRSTSCLQIASPRPPPAVLAMRRAVFLREPLEYVGQKGRRDSDSRVADAELDMRVHSLQQHLDP